eukprot:CAMPEP_0203902602 /NCGR_PEP_ID=MMETSP0359-20131031/44673_1 /ASSEMBLY_ACC=CAM_ASM_000338 /TAXON_ID=268821 /ORGANISM="Scrippsiella Hangoei, Strain SHTV-5" /LENGTH=144 /DNA_ID=CAMNT_0050826495 /DNA_START=47 /DNA_END=477 /DNA_ORIENTATION=+
MKAGATAMETQRLLDESVQEIVRLGKDSVETGPFNKLRTGISRASCGKDGTPDDLLGSLQSKDDVLQYLLRLYEKKRMYKKQIAAALCTLAEVESWAEIMRKDASLAAAVPELQEVLEKPPPTTEPPAWSEAAWVLVPSAPEPT